MPPSSSGMKELCALLNISIGYYIDKVANFTLDRNATIKAKNLRSKAKEKIFADVKDEREQRKESQREQKDKERTAKLDKMNPAAREKFLKKEEEKHRKRRMKKSGG
jgi:hypothetical protein